MLIAAFRNGTESGVDKVFKGFQPAQFFVTLAAVIIYVAAINFLGFYIATAIFLICLLLYLKVPYLHTAIAVAVILALILGPIGILFKSPVSWVLIILSIIGILSPLLMAKMEKKAEADAVSGTAENVEKLTEEDSV